MTRKRSGEVKPHVTAPPPLAVGIKDAARMAGISRATLWALLADGEGPKTFMLGRRRLVRIESLTGWLAELEKVNPAS